MVLVEVCHGGFFREVSVTLPSTVLFSERKKCMQEGGHHQKETYSQ